MKYILVVWVLILNEAFAQHKERTLSISCYVNAELYIQAGVMAHVSNKTGNISCNDRYIHIQNKSGNTFSYKHNNKWLSLKPGGRTVILISGAKISSNAPSVLKLTVKYLPESATRLSGKIAKIGEMNAQTDRVKARQLEAPSKRTVTASKPAAAPAKVSQPSDNKATAPARSPVIAKAEPRSEPTPEPEPRPEPRPQPTTKPRTQSVATRSSPRRSTTKSRTTASTSSAKNRNGRSASSTAIGLRLDLGSGGTGVGPNIKHNFNQSFAIDAAMVFFPENVMGLGAQLQKSFKAKSDPGLSLYMGVGPSFKFYKEETSTALVAVGGLQYIFPGSPVGVSFDWRPNFYLSPASGTEAGRFGLSLRVGL